MKTQTTLKMLALGLALVLGPYAEAHYDSVRRDIEIMFERGALEVMGAPCDPKQLRPDREIEHIEFLKSRGYIFLAKVQLPAIDPKTGYGLPGCEYLYGKLSELR